MIFSSNALVLKRTNFSDNDVLLTLFTSRIGKVIVVANGARHPKNRLASAANPFIYGKFFFMTGSGLSKLNGVDIEKSYYGIREDIVKLAYGTWFLELADMVIVEGEPNIELFEGLKYCLARLEKINIEDNKNNIDNKSKNAKKIDILKMAYEWKLIDKVGLRPLLNECAKCGSKIDNTGYFSCEEGGAICESCAKQMLKYAQMNKYKISIYKMGSTIPKILDFIFSNSVDNIIKTDFHNAYINKLDGLICEYLKIHLGVNCFKSREFLKAINC